MNIRISGGYLKGRRFSVEKSSTLRPTMESTRLTIFSVLNSSSKSINEESVFIDLYSGTGIMGFEALSRGAKKVIFVEKNKNLCTKISDNLDKFDLSTKSEIICSPVYSFLNFKNIKASHIFADPPYRFKEYNKILQQIELNQFLNNNGVIMLEMDNKSNEFIYQKELYDVDDRSKGGTKIIFIKRKSD
tara:strand:+ start:1669 stop:2235 length:567 start_codon:yes stop_codon:yes gene_type:complete